MHLHRLPPCKNRSRAPRLIEWSLPGQTENQSFKVDIIFGHSLSRELASAQSGDVYLIDWSAASSRHALTESARRIARRKGLEIALDPLSEGLRLTVIDKELTGSRMEGSNNAPSMSIKDFNII